MDPKKRNKEEVWEKRGKKEFYQKKPKLNEGERAVTREKELVSRRKGRSKINFHPARRAVGR